MPAAFGAGLILLLLLLAPDLGSAEMLWAAALTAVSPAMVFYSRYYIHEMLLVFFTALTFFCFWRYANSGRAAWAVAGGIGLGLMCATKETFVFALAALALAVGSFRRLGALARGRRARLPAAMESGAILSAALAVGGRERRRFFSRPFSPTPPGRWTRCAPTCPGCAGRAARPRTRIRGRFISSACSGSMSAAGRSGARD